MRTVTLQSLVLFLFSFLFLWSGNILRIEKWCFCLTIQVQLTNLLSELEFYFPASQLDSAYINVNFGLEDWNLQHLTVK